MAKKKCEGIFRGFIDKAGIHYSPDQLPERVKQAVAKSIIQAEKKEGLLSWKNKENEK
ncbi:Hypothetical protein LUCI_1422 [Lucifera butyrica]|uniref:Uncharacterized protein n=1 Tax=Lucifera butyrica TaxID=1351585 RepID=A0A498R0X6_9FIRM|nr:hypothetical protein [Lucifera butyrica]VBB06206.1 Hypothetical protein LUCI_1422 [Lucifera butyrica]